MHPLGADEPTAVGPYRLLGRLGSGGMGRVYLGRSAGGRTVAVKIVHPHFALDEEFRARFRREVAAARRVGGAWTAPVLDADPEAPVPWVATGYAAGPSLTAAVVDVGPLLIDFGIARAMDGTASLNSSGVSIGSPGYMAPEQILGKGVTGAADVFSPGLLRGSPGVHAGGMASRVGDAERRHNHAPGARSAPTAGPARRGRAKVNVCAPVRRSG